MDGQIMCLQYVVTANEGFSVVFVVYRDGGLCIAIVLLMISRTTNPRRYVDVWHDAGKGHFRLLPTHTEAAGDLTVSSLGVGTYLGPETDAADTEYVEAMTKALAVGINVLDTYVTF